MTYGCILEQQHLPNSHAPGIEKQLNTFTKVTVFRCNFMVQHTSTVELWFGRRLSRPRLALGLFMQSIVRVLRIGGG